MATIATGSAGFVRLTFQLESDRADVMLSRTAQGITRWQPFFRDYLAPKFFDDVRRNIEVGGAYVGGWAPLSRRYAAWKARHYPGKGLMQRTLRLMRSFEPGSGENILRVTDRSAEFGTAVSYGAFHQRGTRRMPRRRLLFLPAGASESYGRLLHRYVRDVIAESSGSTMGGPHVVSRFL